MFLRVASLAKINRRVVKHSIRSPRALRKVKRDKSKVQEHSEI